MDLLKSLNEQIAETEKEAEEIRVFLTEMEEFESKNLFRLDEIFGSKAKEKEKELAARKYAMDRGKHGSVNKNRESKWDGGVMGEGILAALHKKYGKPVFKNGMPPKRPDGMEPSEYRMWIDAAEDVKDTDVGPAVGPDVGDIIKAAGKMYQVRGNLKDQLASVILNSEGKKVKVSWEKLSKPKEVEGRQVFTYTG